MENCKECEGMFCELLKTIPPNYPVAAVYVNGKAIRVWSFSNICAKSCLAYFLDEDGLIVTINCFKIDGIAFGESEIEEEEEEECC